MNAHPLAAYLEDCLSRYKTGATTPETSLYSPLETLLNVVGKKLKPRVRCFMNLKNQGGDMPDGGLFTPDQIPKKEDEPLPGQKPSRGVVECKKPGDDLANITNSKQVSRYWDRYQQVLVTNYREFALIGRDDKGQPVRHEFCTLAESEKAFWKLAAQPQAAAKLHEERLLDFLERCLRRPVPLTDPKDVAWFLASYARDALHRVEHAGAHEQMATVRKALEDALGLKIQDAKGEHFFQSTLVQTLFYGLFSAWVLWHRQLSEPGALATGVGARFDWDKTSHYLRIPILRKLFREMTDPSDLKSWDNLTEVMGWAADTLNRVDRTSFFEKFQDTQAVQYFYEPFLEAFDPELRKQLGVWYTPPEIVKYMVTRVDQVLKSDFNRPDGLADESVFVLDPCCGTGAFLVETLSSIEATLREKGDDALLAEQLKKAATNRIFGFEILPAPFVVAHLQLGLFLQKHGSSFNERKKERTAVYLTNALTGWKPPIGAKQKLLFPEMEEERDAADRIKQKVPILVVLGNPPYNGYAGIPVEEEKGLVEPYRTTKTAPKPQGQGLNDLYIRFFRLAERCITERHAQHGIVCYISNYSWLDGLSHTGLRERFAEEFDQIWIDNLNGDKYKTGKVTPEGKPDPSVFSTPQNREGIQVGTAVALMARTPKHQGPADIRFRDFWGESKREDLLASGVKFQPKKYSKVKPVTELGVAFRPMETEANYTSWPLLTELFPESFPGVKTSRDDDLVDFDKKSLEKRIASYFDPEMTIDDLREICPRLVKDASRFDADSSRKILLKRGMLHSNIVKYAYRPFDHRWVYWEPLTKLLDEKRPELFKQITSINYFLFTTGRTRKDQIEPAIVSTNLTDLNFMDSGVRGTPLYVKLDDQLSFGEHRDQEFKPNVTDAASEYLNSIKCSHEQLFFHSLTVIQSNEYRSENFSGLKSNWPRIPLPADRKTLLASAELGRQVAALLDPETPVDTVTAGKMRPELKVIGSATRTTGGQFTGNHFAITARWGITGQGGITMPAKGKAAPRQYTEAEKTALGKSADLLGSDTLDIYLNDNAYWKNIPRSVWEYTLGGYQVLKKWLSYREESILGRTLNVEEVSYFTQVARRIAALLLLGPSLDENYQTVKAKTFEWK